jgi:hypothetical protein
MAATWEYCYLSTRKTQPDVVFCGVNEPIQGVMKGLGWERTIARLGAYGWELAGVQKRRMYLKRPVQSGRAIDDAAQREDS